MTHTAKPWIVNDHVEPNNIDILNDQGRIIAEIMCPPMVEEYKIPDDSRPECEANARLIAAAPALLEALKMIIAPTSEHYRWRFIKIDEYRQIEKAIALTEGSE